MKFKWELVETDEEGNFTCRAKVHGGWIVKDIEIFEVKGGEEHIAMGMIFLPDHTYEWSIDEK